MAEGDDPRHHRQLEPGCSALFRVRFERGTEYGGLYVSGYTYADYLGAKKTVDDRALNKDVFESLRRELAQKEKKPLILEIGAGLGTMVARLIEWRLIDRADYTLLDIDAELLGSSRRWLSRWVESRGMTAEATPDTLRIRGPGDLDWTVRFVQAEVRAFLDAQTTMLRADLLVANAFLDLVDVPATLPSLFKLAAERGLYWFSINFDGDTIFEPGHPNDEAFMRVYHESMDERVRYGRPAGDSKTGRHLFRHLAAARARVLSAGASDWIVFAEGGKYHAEEAHFLHHMVHVVDEELKQHAQVDRSELAAWVRLRHDQIDRGELVYVAHQIDFCGRVKD